MVPTPETALTSTACQQDAWRHLVAVLCKCRKSSNPQVRAAKGCPQEEVVSRHSLLMSCGAPEDLNTRVRWAWYICCCHTTITLWLTCR
jgi:hypothetical protein